MEIYKFRKLTSETDYCRLRNILETGYFWCSSFWKLNDPMEGVFMITNPDNLKRIFEEKEKYKICSFSGEDGFKNPAMWGYYTDGFKGVAIKVEINDNEIEEVHYENKLPIDNDDMRKILTNKLKKWKPENEFRFLINSENNYQKIGKITAVYFGDPYGNAENKKIFEGKIENFTQYTENREKIKKSTDGEGIICHDVEIKNGEVIKSDKNL